MTDTVPERRGSPRPLTPYVASIGLFGVGTLATAVAVSPGAWRGEPALLSLLLIAVLTVLAPLRFQHVRGVQGFVLDEGALIAMLFVLPGSLPALAMTAATVVAHLILRTSPIKLAFNAGQMALAATAGLTVFRVVGATTDVISLRSIAAAMTAALVHNVASSLAMAGLFRRLEGRGILETLSSVWKLNAITLLGNTSFGLVLAVVALADPDAAILAATLLVGLHLGYRGYVGQMEERRRTESLHGFTRSLLDVRTFLDSKTSLFELMLGSLGGTQVVLGLSQDGDDLLLETHPGGQGDTGGSSMRVVAQRLLREVTRRGEGFRVAPGDRLASTMVQIGERDAMAVPIYRRDEIIGVLALFGRVGLEPWGTNHLALFATMAAELSVGLENVALFHQVEEERARLEAESTKLNDILGAASDGIASILADGTIEAWNPGMAQITGVAIEAAVGQPWHAVLRLKGTDGRDLAPTGNHVVRRAVAGEFAGGSLSLQALRADGTWRWLQCTSSPVRDPDGQHRGVVVVARDVTTERELEDLKADFISTVSHELRTPLTPLKGFLATLRSPRTALTEDQVESIHGSMSTQLTRLETLISDLLAVAELDHGQFNLYPEPLALGDLIRETVEVEAADQYSRCTVTVDPDASAVADSVALVRVVRSLVSNAVKHTEGGVEVTVRAVGERVEIAVADEGPGIASWDQQRVFNRFERLGDHLRRTQGPGLGLTIARTLAQRMDGDVSVSSDIGAGATFVLSLPRARPRAVETSSGPAVTDRRDDAVSQ